MKVGVTAWVRMGHGNYLLIGQKEGYEGLYLTPGGGIEDRETAEEAVVREVYEETNVRIADPLFITYYERVQHGREHVVILLFSASGKGKPRAGSDVGEVRVATFSELLELRNFRRLSPLAEMIASRMADSLGLLFGDPCVHGHQWRER